MEVIDEGCVWINVVDVKDLKKIKMCVVVSFNEDVDGLYGICNKEVNVYNKYVKEDYNNFFCDIINMVNNIFWVKDYIIIYIGVFVFENGCFIVVIDEFEVVFVILMVFYVYEVGFLYDKY